jgi:hypothetical protein
MAQKDGFSIIQAVFLFILPGKGTWRVKTINKRLDSM